MSVPPLIVELLAPTALVTKIPPGSETLLPNVNVLVLPKLTVAAVAVPKSSVLAATAPLAVGLAEALTLVLLVEPLNVLAYEPE